MGEGRLFIRIPMEEIVKAVNVGFYMGIAKLIKKLEELGKGDYLVYTSGSAINDFPDTIVVISCTKHKDSDDIKKDFSKAFGENAKFYNPGDQRQVLLQEYQ